jgi:hypothetical protein
VHRMVEFGLTRGFRLTQLTKGLAECRQRRNLTKLELGGSHPATNHHTHPACPDPLTLLPHSKARACLPTVVVVVVAKLIHQEGAETLPAERRLDLARRGA